MPGTPFKARDAAEREAKRLLVDMERLERGEFVRGYGSDKQRESQAARAQRKADRAARQKRLEAESAARVAAKGGQGQRVILNARANLMVEDAAREGRELTFEEAKKIVVRESRERWKDYLRSIGAIPGEARNPNPNL